MRIAQVLALIIISSISVGIFLGAYAPDATYSAELLLGFVITVIGWHYLTK